MLNGPLHAHGPGSTGRDAERRWAERRLVYHTARHQTLVLVGVLRQAKGGLAPTVVRSRVTVAAREHDARTSGHHLHRLYERERGVILGVRFDCE